eukprot:c25149_g2_i1 orf=242-1672(+)
MMKFFSLVSLVGAWKLAVYLFIASCSCVSFTEVRAQVKLCVSVALDPPARRRAPITPSFRKRVDLVHRQGAFPKRPAEIKAAMAEMLMRENGRIGFIKAKLNVGEPDSEQLQSSTQTPLYSGQTIGSANYIITIGLGTPAQELSVVIDTGSDLAWTQCAPCIACYNQTHPLFNPSASSSYQQVTCASPECSQLGSLSTSTCSSANATTNCKYRIDYLDGSFTNGDFALDTLTVGSDVASTTYPFGCGHQNQGLFTGLDGLLGFSRDPLAFSMQTKAIFGQIFAYCLPPIFSSSPGYIAFGGEGDLGSENTPLVALNTTSLYVVVLEYIKVECSSTIITPINKAFVVDSGTVITRLDISLYNEVRDAFRMATSSSVSLTSPPTGFEAFDTCYSVSDTTNDNIDQLFPYITFSLKGSLDFTPQAHNLVIPVDSSTVCLALLPLNTSSGLSILGNYQQQGHLFTFDIPGSTLSITYDAC